MRRKRALVFGLVLLPLLIDTAEADLKERARDAFKKCRLTLQMTCPDPMNIKFHLFTRQNKAESQRVQVTETRDNLDKSFFNPSHPNKLIIHGLNPHVYKSDLVAVKDAYLTKEEANVWMVNWSKLAKVGTCTMFSLYNSNHVAHCIAQLVNAINRHSPQPKIHVVADRAGGRIAHILAHSTSIRLARITGLNPERSLAAVGQDSYRLSPWDADFVDTIHTTPFLPKTAMFGQIDFYVNPNRFHQPGCDEVETGKFACDQRRAIQYFAESITSQVGFVAWECPSYANFALGTCNPHPPPQTMGESCPSGSAGLYITYTAEESPYALGHWESELYQEKGAKVRTDKISQYSISIKRRIEMIEENTPDIVKELGLVDSIMSRLNDKTEGLKSTAINIGMKGVKVMADQIMKKKQLVNNENSAQNVGDTVESNK